MAAMNKNRDGLLIRKECTPEDALRLFTLMAKTGADMRFLETREFNRSQMALVFSVPEKDICFGHQDTCPE